MCLPFFLAPTIPLILPSSLPPSLLRFLPLTFSLLQVNALVKGVEVGMAAGEIPIKLITPNIQLTIESSLLTYIGNSTYAIPPTPSQTAYGAVQS